MDHKREVFFLKILCHIFESDKSRLPFKLKVQALEMSLQKLFRELLYLYIFFGNEISGAIICHGTTKGRLPFLQYIKVSKQHFLFFWPALRFLGGFQKLLCTLTCTSIMRSKDHKRDVNRTTKGLLTK